MRRLTRSEANERHPCTIYWLMRAIRRIGLRQLKRNDNLRLRMAPKQAGLWRNISEDKWFGISKV